MMMLAFDFEKVKSAVRLLLEGIGEDPNRPDLLKTPERVAEFYKEFCSGADGSLKVIGDGLAEKHDEIVLVRDITFYSLCEHHLLPFWGRAHIAYLPREGRLVGISKLARLLGHYAGRLQVQERLAAQIADALMREVKPLGAMVVIEAQHMCLQMRGVKREGSVVVTSVVRGIFRENEKTRMETLFLMNRE